MTQGLFGVPQHGIIIVRKRKTPLQTKQKSTVPNFKNFTKHKQNSQNNQNKLFFRTKDILSGFRKSEKNAVKAKIFTKNNPLKTPLPRIFAQTSDIYP